jgi:hypothetical protein
MARCFDLALGGDKAAMAEFRRWSDRFGLSPMGRLKNRCLVEPPTSETEEAASNAAAAVIRLHSRGPA